MKFMNLPNRPVPLWKMLFSCCIMLGLMTVLCSAAAPDEDVCTGAEMGSYAELGFCLPPQVVVEPEAMEEANYTGGREVAASMQLNGSRIGLHLLYPCIAPQKELKPAELKPYLEAYNPILAQANYNESVTGPVLWGQVANQIFVAYQPNNQTVAMVFMDINMSENMMTTFLGNLSLVVNEGVTPPGNCQDTTDTTNTTDTTDTTDTTASPAEDIAPKNQTASLVTDNKNLATGKDKMAADMDAARAKLEAAREKMRRS